MKSLLFIGFLLMGCGDDGPPSQFQTCKDRCAFLKGCFGGTTDADVKACQTQCQTDKAQYDSADSSIKTQCKNANDIMRGIHGCMTQDCDGVVAGDCAQAFVDSCQPK